MVIQGLSMGDQRNYAALDWVLGEIEETLNDARLALEAYVENPKDSTQLRFCITHIHQVRGSLHIVEFHGASLLAEEMEHLAQALMNQKVSNVNEAHEVLMRSLLQLPIYLDHVKVYRDDTARSILPLLNDIRAIRKESYLSESNLFTPNLSALSEIVGQPHPAIQDAEKVKQVTGKLREMYQFAAASVLRNIKVRENLEYLEKVFSRLVVLTSGTASAPLWKISSALIEGLKDESIEHSIAVKGLLRHLARELRILSEQAPASFHKSAPEGLIKNLLYYVARSDSKSALIVQIKKQYELTKSELGGGEENVDGYNVSALDPEAVRSVVTALREELKSIKSNLDTVLTSRLPPLELAEILPVVKRVADTLAVLGIRELRETMLMQAEFLHDLSQRNSLDEAGLVESAGHIIDVDSKLEAISKAVDRHRDLSSINERSIEIDEAKLAVLRECQIGLEKVKDAIIEYISSQWDVGHLTNIDHSLNDIRGGLDMVPLPRAGAIIGQCAQYIIEELIRKEEEPSWKALDALADAMASVEYFLERLSNDMSEDAESLLEVAEQSVASLGYAVDQGADTRSEQGSERIAAQTDNQHGEVRQEAQQDEAQPAAQENTSVTYAPNEEPPVETSHSHLVDAKQNEPVQQDNLNVSPERTAEPRTDFEPEESDIDDEIIEIFIEEAQEVLGTLSEYIPKWLANLDDDESLSVVRRAYHTLKGSGRMVEALEIGELAWSVENMLNRVIDESVQYTNEHGQLVELVTALLPVMVEAFQGRYKNPERLRADTYSRWAFALAEGKRPEDFDLNLGMQGNAALAQSATDDTRVEEMTSGLESGVNVPEVVEDEDAEDYVLLEIFSSEVETHLATIRTFIADMEAEAPLYTPPTDELQRALHTLKGSAKMAQVSPIAHMYEALESFAKEMVTFQVSLTDDVLQLMRDAVSYTEIVLEQIEARAQVEIEKLEQFLARAAELREMCVGHLVRMKEQEKDGEKPVDPRLLSIFMAEEMRLLLDADEIVEAWCAQPEQSGPITELVTELNTLAVGADQAKLPDMSVLALKLKSIYSILLDNISRVDDQAHHHLKTGHAALLDMVDAVAAGQNVQSPRPELMVELKAYLEHLKVAPTAPDDVMDVEEAPSFEQASPFETDGVLDLDGQQTTEEIADADQHAELAGDVFISEALNSDGDELQSNSLLEDGAFEPGDIEQPDLNGIEGDELLQHESHELEEAQPDIVLPETIESDAIESEATEPQLSGFESAPEPIHEEGVATQDETVPEIAASQEGLLDAIDTSTEDYDADILEVFLEECDELFEELDEAINVWESDADVSAVEEMKRALHTMKGGARLSGMPVLGDLVHDYESYLIGSNVSAMDEAAFAEVHGYQDKIFKGVSAVKVFLGTGNEQAIPDENAAADIPSEADNPHQPESAETYSSGVTEASIDAELEAPSDTGAAIENNDDGTNILPFVNKPKVEAPEPGGQEAMVAAGGGVATAAAKKAGPQEVVRINSELLEELVNLAGETSISRSRLEEQVTEFRLSLDEVDSTIDRLQEQLRRLDIETEAQVLFRQEQMAEHEEAFDPLEMDRYSHLQQLSRSLMESASDLHDLRADLSNKVKDAETTLLQQSRINTTLQEGLMRSRMVPFSRLVPRLRRIVRQVSSELGKKVSFELDNVEGELDRNVLERMVPPFEHMLRNAVDHGIESPEERIAKGKPESGRIVLTLGREGGNVIIRLADDGRGVDLQRVRNKAIERGLMDANAELSDHDIMQFILHAGFSTAESVTQISGRGVGMDVVNAEIKQLGGDVSIDSEWGKGTEFVIHLPFTLSVNRALMVTIGKDQYAIPLNTIEGIVRVSPFELDHYYSHPDSEFEYAKEQFKVRYLGSLLYAGRKANLEGHILPLPVVLVRSAQHTMALQVDSLMGSREIVVKSLGAQFSAVQGLSGATIMGDGSVVVILDPHAIVRQEIAKSDLLIDAANKAQLELAAEALEKAEAAEVVRTIMVVDDSVTVRKVTTRFLEREGFNVITAKDGVDALRILQDEIPDLMLLDIEMPRMDGFEVAKNIRTTQRWKHLPIIMITSRTGDKHREHALSLGVNRYMGKPYQEDLLLENIEALVGDQAET